MVSLFCENTVINCSTCTVHPAATTNADAANAVAEKFVTSRARKTQSGGLLTVSVTLTGFQRVGWVGVGGYHTVCV